MYVQFNKWSKAWKMITTVVWHIWNTHTPTQNSVCAQSPSGVTDEGINH